MDVCRVYGEIRSMAMRLSTVLGGKAMATKLELQEAVEARGAILYDGPSLLDGAPIVVIATGLRSKSTNSKTGAMVQTYILRSDVHPVEAVHSGADESICGVGENACPLRPAIAEEGAARCYVNKGFGPAAVYRGYLRGIYPVATAADVVQWAKGRPIRFGTYGDPAAAPLEIWEGLAAVGKRTGYSHQWRIAAGLSPLAMASVGSSDEALLAQAMGWRTFRVRRADEALLPGEIVCPASEEGGRRTQCETCGLCSGKRENDRRANIAIIDHGPTARKVSAS